MTNFKLPEEPSYLGASNYYFLKPTIMSNANGSSSPPSERGEALFFVAGVTTLALGAAAAFYAFRQKRSISTLRDWEGATVCITGGSSGIGKAVALNLGRRGARVLIGCRNVELAQREVCDVLGNDKCDVFAVDLAKADSVEIFGERIRNATVRSGLHLLVNNAGAMLEEKDKVDEHGWDRTMAINHIGWVQLTRQLLPVLTSTSSSNNTNGSLEGRPVRVINVGSTLEKGAKLPSNQEDPGSWDRWIKTSLDPYSSFPAYANAKLAMTATTFHFASHVLSQQEGQQHRPIHMMIVSPGMVNTSLPRFLPPWKRVVSWPIRKLLLKTPEQGAESILFAALHGRSGDYIRNTKAIQATAHCSAAAKDPRVGQHIYEATLRAIDMRNQ